MENTVLLRAAGIDDLGAMFVQVAQGGEQVVRLGDAIVVFAVLDKGHGQLGPSRQTECPHAGGSVLLDIGLVLCESRRAKS